jgi:hypothetical protein
MSNLVNAFGKIALDENSRDVEELLNAILVELRIMNIQLSIMTGDEIGVDEIDRYGE